MTENPNVDPDNITDLEAFKKKFLAASSSTPLPAPGGPAFQRPPTRRRPLRLPDPPATTARYRVRVDLIEAEPPIWRRMTLPGDLTLDRVHDALQAAFGWTNSHLHRFSPTDDRYGGTTQDIVTQFDIDEGEDGVLETGIRLDQLIERPGDSFYYTYDLGDDWEHQVVVESVDPLDPDDRVIRCLDGRREAPPEDSGGIHWYQHMREVAADPRHPEYADLEEQLAWLPPEAEPDLDAINRTLARLDGAADTLAWLRGQSTPLAEIVLRLGEDAQLYAAGFVTDAWLADPVEVTEADAEQATAVFRTFLGHVGDGIRLTPAGYLPPASVIAMMRDLDPEEHWIGTPNREAAAQPLLWLRETATALGLVRKYRGQLLLTRQGQRLRDAPVELWHYLAARLPVEGSVHERNIGVLLLLLVAAGEAESTKHLRDSLDLMSAMIGLRFEGGSPHFPPSAMRFVGGTASVLQWAGTGTLLTRKFYEASLGLAGSRLLARAALAT